MSDAPHTEPHPENAPEGKPLVKRVLTWARRLFIGGTIAFFVSLLLVYFLLLLPPVQRFAVQEISTALSSELGTSVGLGGLQMQLFDKFILLDLAVQDREGGELLNVDRVEVNFQALIFNMVRRRLVVQDLTLQGARFNWVHRAGEEYPNIQFLKDYFKNEKKDTLREPFALELGTFFLKEAQFIKLDSVRGSRALISVREADGVVNRFDLQAMQIDAKHLFFDGLRIEADVFDFDSAFWLERFPEQSLPFIDPETYRHPLAGLPNLCVDIFHLRDGSFQLSNIRKEPERLSAPEVLNFNHLDVFNIDVVVRSLSFSDQQFYGHLDLFSFEERSGFELTRLTAGDAKVSGETVELYDMRLITPRSNLGDTLVLNYKYYSDFKNFTDAVRMDVRLHESSIWLDDILNFAPALERNLFFQKNRNEVLSIEGAFSGKVNSLRGRDLRVRLARNTVLEGDFSSLFLAVPDLTSLNLRLKRLETDMRTLRELIPGFNVPPNFDKLGRLNFSGSFDGFFTDFVAYGDLRTQLGRATLDMKFAKGRDLPQYSGELELINFNLREFTGNPQFGNITLSSRVLDGQGLTGATANARLEAKIDSFAFRDYLYQNLEMEGQLNRNLFDGKFGIQDQNIDFDFVGAIDFTQAVPFFDFKADVRRVDVKRLNLLKQDYVFSGQVELKVRDVDLSKIEGQVELRNFIALKDRDKIYTLDSMLVFAGGTGDQKYLSLQSELMTGQMTGRFNLNQLPAIFTRFLNENYQVFSERLKIAAPKNMPDTSYFNLDLALHDTRDWLELLIPSMGPIVDGKVGGYFNSMSDSMFLRVELPAVALGNAEFKDVYLAAKAQRDTCSIDFGIFQTFLGAGRRELAPINFLGLVNRDTVNFAITAIDYDKVLDKLEMDGVFFLDSLDFIVRFSESRMVILNNEWNIAKNNFLRFGKDFVQTRDFALSSGQRRIILHSLDRRGLQLLLRNFDLSDLNGIIEYEPIQFAGGIDMEVSFDDVFQLSGLRAAGRADSLFLNKDDFGVLQLSLEAENLRSPLQAAVTVSRGEQQLTVNGFYNPPNYEHDPARRGHPNKSNYLNAEVGLKDFPLSFLEIWIGSGVTNTQGLVNGGIKVVGDAAKPDLNGKATISQGAVTINFLNTRYFVDEQTVTLTSNMIDATGAVLTDQFGNKATVTGGIAHDRIKNMSLDAQIRSDNFLMLNTKKGQNDLFYGTAIASGYLVFSGPFVKPDIYVNATSKPGTQIVLPISSTQKASEVRFVRFTQRYSKPEVETPATSAQELLGVSVEMDLNITDDAVIEMVFDEQAGDVLRGRGTGAIRMVVPRTGGFYMYGEYVVSSGNYLFTLMNLVNKPFEVRRGGTIRWSGDPFGAEINIEAEYKDLKATLTNFLAEYLITDTQENKTAARIPTDVDLIMKLSGELLKPTVGFDIQFPRILSDDLRRYTDTKMRILAQDQNEMNRQVFGLIVIGQFLPSQFGLPGQELAIGINTMTEMLSQQLSLYLTGLVSEWLTEGGLISGIDFDIAYNYMQGVDLNDPDQVYRTNELQVRLKNYFFDDRLAVNVGGNFDLTGGANIPGATPNSSGVFFAGDLAVEYFLTRDQNLKIRFYQSTQPEIGGGSRNRTGLGLSFRREFETFEDFLNGLKGTTRKLRRASKE